MDSNRRNGLGLLDVFKTSVNKCTTIFLQLLFIPAFQSLWDGLAMT